MRSTEKVTISVDKELLRKIDDYRDKHYLKRSAVFSMGASNLILQDEMIEMLEEMRNLLHKANQQEKLSDDDKRQMEQFTLLCNAMLGNFDNNK